MKRARLLLANRQRHVPLPLADLRRLTRRAVTLALVSTGPGAPVLPGLTEVEVTFVSDAAIGRVHAEFMGDPSPTDVITFAHGEILVSAQTAAREAAARGEPLERELIRYLVHGLLHLNGHEDDRPERAAAMWAAQEAAVAELTGGR